jgi:hypothetical protein
LGWRIHRVWSTDWWHKRGEQIDKISAAIDKARMEGGPVNPQKEGRANTEAPAPAVARIAAAPAVASPATQTETRPNSGGPALPEYVPYASTSTGCFDEDFYSPSTDSRMAKVLQTVVTKEGPISLELATKRTAFHYGVQRATSKAVDRIAGIARRTQIRQARHGNKVFLWPPDVDPTQYRVFRVPGDSDESKRKADDIPPEEVANAALFVLEQQVSLPLEDLVTETSRLLGYQRSGSVVDKSMRDGIGLLFAQQRAATQDGMVVQL